MLDRPLEGLRVLDLSRLLPGGFLTQLFADLGADVVKVEEPDTGDYARWIPPDLDGAGYAFSAVNRGNRSVGIDLKAEGARDLVLRLAARSDVLVESFRPGVLDRLGLDDATLERANPRLVRVSLVGYPPGPCRDWPGHDLNYQALAGILGVQGAPGRAALPGAQSADVAGALYGAVGVLAALHARERTGRGARLEVALSDAALAVHALAVARAATGEPLPERGAWELCGGIAAYDVYRCRDGREVALGALEPKFWTAFVRAAGLDHLEAHLLDPDARAEVAARFLERDADEWIARLTKAGVPATPVLDPREALAHPVHAHAARRPGPATPLTRAPSTAAPPRLGEHTDDVLHEAGVEAAERARLRETGAIR